MSLSVRLTHAVGGLDLDIAFEAGSGVTAIFGPSGSGKTTIVNALAGLLRPDAGRISLNGVTLFDSVTGRDLAACKRRVGYVFQEGRLFPHFTVEGNIRFGARFAPDPPDAAEIRRVIAMLGLERLLPRRPGRLSGGEKQRVALARALLSRPKLLLLDEPLAALDEPRKNEVLPYLERLRDDSRVPIVYVSHAMAEVARLADDLVILRAGRVMRAGAAAEVLSDPAVLPLVGVREAGSILPATVVEHGRDGLTRLAISGGELLLPGVRDDVGTSLRIRVLAQDILLSLERPVGLSSRNVLAVTIQEIRRGSGPGVAVQLGAAEDRLLARITARAADELGLRPGLSCYAILKATAVPRGSIGRA